MKKVIGIVVLIAVIFSLFTGCNIKEKAEKKASETLTENMLESAMNGKNKVDVDGNNITIKDKDGNETTIGKTSWPTGKTADLIPKCNNGKVIGVLNSTNACVITLNDLKKNDYTTYVDAVKKAGYTTDPYELDLDETKSYAAKKDEKTTISVTYTEKEAAMVITLGVSE